MFSNYPARLRPAQQPLLWKADPPAPVAAPSAVQRAAALAADGSRVLLTCATRPTADRLRRALDSATAVTVQHFPLVCYEAARDADLLPLRPDSRDDFYRLQLPKALLAALDRGAPRYDAIVVVDSEAFAPAWWVALTQLLDGAGGMLVVCNDSAETLPTTQPHAVTLPN
jgi:hypothetical protein